MKLVYLLRHGKADRPAGGVPDKQRPLLPRGSREVAKMCRKMVKKGMTPEVIISSTATRAFETAEVAARELGYNADKIERMDEIYGAEADELRILLQNQQEDRNSVLMVGHNPGLEELAAMLTRDYSGHQPTGGVIAIRLAIPSWRDLKPGCGQLITTLFP